jgi:mono/diheme cytochrome c family protein
MLRIFQRTTGRVAGSISRRRRSRFAAPAVLLIGLLATGGVYAAFTPADAAKQDDASEIAKGKALFLVGCSSCHGMNGEGITTKRGKQLGPPLVGVGAAAVDFQVGTGRMPMAQPGAQAPRKKVLSASSGRTSPPWAPGRRSPPSRITTSPTPATRASSAVARSSAPTAPRATTSPAPAVRCRRASTRPSSPM